jgi:hypothetical protein
MNRIIVVIRRLAIGEKERGFSGPELRENIENIRHQRLRAGVATPASEHPMSDWYAVPVSRYSLIKCFIPP